jgi:uncharacterized protein (DUF1499 family)
LKKLFVISIVIIIVIGLSALIGLGGSQPKNVGDAKVTSLAACNESKTNCVASNASTPYHAMEAWKVKDSLKTMTALSKLISETPQANIIIHKNNYLYIQYKSTFFKFIDDVEFLLTSNDLIQFRSASRLGKKDFGVNRERINQLEILLRKRLK